MNVNEGLQAITTVGFPCVASAALFWQNHELTLMFRDEAAKNREALVNNTAVMQELSTTLKAKNE